MIWKPTCTSFECGFWLAVWSQFSAPLPFCPEINTLCPLASVPRCSGSWKYWNRFLAPKHLHMDACKGPLASHLNPMGKHKFSACRVTVFRGYNLVPATILSETKACFWFLNIPGKWRLKWKCSKTKCKKTEIQIGHESRSPESQNC